MSDARKLGPLQTANVKLASKDQNGQPEVVFVGRGETLPANLADGEVTRLEAAGAFAGPPRAITMTVPEAAVELTSFLPPQVTLAANDEDGNVVAGTPAVSFAAPAFIGDPSADIVPADVAPTQTAREGGRRSPRA